MQLKSQKFSYIITLLFILLIIVVVALCFYCFILGNKIVKQAREIRENLNIAQLTINFGEENKRIFKGDTTAFGLNLSEVLEEISRAGKFELSLKQKESGEIFLEKIENKENYNGHYWTIAFPQLGWVQALDSDFDLRRIILTGGIDAEMVYR